MQSRTVLSQDVCLSVCLFVRHSPVLCGISLLPDVLKCRPTDQTCSWLHRCGPCSLDRRHRRMIYEYICRCGIEIAPSHRSLTSFTARCHVMVEKIIPFHPEMEFFHLYQLHCVQSLLPLLYEHFLLKCYWLLLALLTDIIILMATFKKILNFALVQQCQH